MIDNYHISEQTIKEPPVSIGQKLKLLGPGFILSASIVGSGELIATTTLGAKAGFTAFWVIIVSCLVKVAVQLEFGKHTILSGETAMKAFNQLPGPTFGKGRWSVWLILALVTLKIVQVGGIMGGAAIVLTMLFPGIPIAVWIIVMAIVVATLIYKGYYSWIEKLSVVMIVMFTVMTIASVCFLSFTPYRITWPDIVSGMQFQLSGEIAAVAIGAFGITGVASDEIIAYNYWCIEKGYAAYTGPKREGAEWQRRASGWIRVMYLDAIVAMVIYTTVTGAFYLLGAAVLNERGIVPEGNKLIETLAYIYTESLGKGINVVYLIGAFFVLFSSLFATLAAWTRWYPDIFSQFGWINFYDTAQRKRVIAWLSWTLPTVWACVYLFIELPVVMILFGGAVGSFLLLLVVFAALHLRYRRTDFFKPGIFYDLAFWISAVSILAIGIYGVIKVFE